MIDGSFSAVIVAVKWWWWFVCRKKNMIVIEGFITWGYDSIGR